MTETVCSQRVAVPHEVTVDDVSHGAHQTSNWYGKANQLEIAVRKLEAASVWQIRTEGEMIDVLLDRYFALLRYGRREIQKNFMESELLFIASATQSAYLVADRGILNNLPIRMCSRIESSLHHDQIVAKSLAINGKGILAKLNALSFSGHLALIDVVERWFGSAQSEASIMETLNFDPLSQMGGNKNI